jgi:Ni,Fe-hydrogenase I cytochrome b subunit
MKYIYILKQVIIFILIIIIISAIILSFNKNKKEVITSEYNTEEIINSLDEKTFIEQYIRDNISTLAIDNPILGGSWYVVSIIVNPITHTGEIIYEDGHVQSKANIIYTYQENPQSVVVTKWEVEKVT